MNETTKGQNEMKVTINIKKGRKMMTATQVTEQRERFDAFLNALTATQLVNIAKHSIRADIKGHSGYVLIGKILDRANVERALYYPGTNLFYGEILERKSIEAFYRNLKKA